MSGPLDGVRVLEFAGMGPGPFAVMMLEWCRVFAEAKADACFAPVLSPGEAPADPHNAARGTFLTRDGVTFPAPAPRLSRTPAAAGGPPPAPGQDTAEVLRDWGFEDDAIAELRSAGAVG